GDYQSATQRFWEAADRDRDNPDSYYNLAVTHHQLGKQHRNPKELEQAELYYNQCLDRDGNHLDCNRGLAVLLVEQGQSDNAFKLLEGWADRSPDNANARVELARLSEEVGDRARAKSLLESALIIEPRNSRALAALGRIYENMGEHRQALLVYERSLASNTLQPAVAQRVASLRTSLGGVAAPSSLNGPTRPGGTRIVTSPSNDLR
ncbi:MAG: tetratricopeptide repeat protein, partial [Planctomycetales bacterium]